MAEDRRERDDQQDGSIRTHVSVYLTFGLFFLILNLLTGPGDLWFYWPMLGWGMVLMMHAFAVYGADAPVKLVELVQSFAARLTPERPVPPVIRQAPAARARATAASAAPAAEARLDHVVSEGEARVDAMRARARRIPKPVIRDQALRLSASADRILAVLGETPENQQLASDFVSRYLTPAEAIVSRYARLAARDVPSAAPTLAKVESEDLPLLEQKMSELYDRLHRGDLIDLEVAREMLAFDFASTPAFPRSDTLRQTTADTSPVRS